jgi:hypothetical protein
MSPPDITLAVHDGLVLLGDDFASASAPDGTVVFSSPITSTDRDGVSHDGQGTI